MRLLKKLKIWRSPVQTARPSFTDHVLSTNPQIILVSHEASRTGAPLILLNLLRYFQQQFPAEYFALLHEGGVLHADFAQLATTDCLDLPRHPSPNLSRRIAQWIQLHRIDPARAVAVCNSMESRFITEQLHAHRIPVVSLIHELPSSYSESDYQLVYSASEKVVFPAQCVRTATDLKLSIPHDKALVMPQGLLNPRFGSHLNRHHARQAIRHELNLPDTARIVLGCGTLDMRKGIDHFAQVAMAMLRNVAIKHPVHFVWIGDGPRWPHSTFHYVQMDLHKQGASRQVHFIGERDDVQPYFLAADAFLMSSRVDPFPCVIHEAMAAELPIVTFSDNGGACEALADGAGIVVPYGDYVQAAKAIGNVLQNRELSKQLTSEGKRRVQYHYNFADYGHKLLHLTRSYLPAA
ncbi:MAG TPA: glycosyltransferase [Pirellulaceae bacterium]|nr:glycosyltransferase [Pirellulaceae bacterium]